ncbi:hypothetical protein Dimus_017517 [Dionaea muscipula]
MALLGEDGRGYELACKLEACGVWRPWLGDSLYLSFVHSLSSPSSWASFMRSDDSKSRAHLQLQLRVRALLFDKATVSLFLRTPPPVFSSSSAAVSKLNPNYLYLHGDDVYFTLEDTAQQRDQSKVHSRGALEFGSRNNEFEIDHVSQRFRREDFPDTWYSQFIENYRVSRPYMISSAERDPDKRTPSEMSNYVKLLERHKRRRITFKEDPYAGFGNSISENISNMQSGSVIDGDTSADEGANMFPEIMFVMNCVPDSALPPRFSLEEKPKVEFFGVLDALPRVPQVATKNSIMIERLGIRPEYLSMDQGSSPYRTRVGLDGKRRQLSQEQAVQMSKKVVARLLATQGFEGATEVPVEVLSQFLSCYISKLGNTLKILADSYKKQCSASELLRMFLHTVGYGNLAALAEQIKDGRNSVQQNTQQMPGVPSQLILQHQNSLQQVQITRQMHSQMQQISVNQNMSFQHQQMLERMRRRPVAPTSGPVMGMDKDRPLLEVKVENPGADLPMDANAAAAFNVVNIRNPQLQLRQHQHQLAVIQRLQAQSGGQFRQLSAAAAAAAAAAAQVPQGQMPAPNASVTRAPPVKVEGFQELMGGDASTKHESDDTKLTPPSK